MTVRTRLYLVFATFAVALMPPAAEGQGYGGPSLLSRGGNRPGQRGRAPINFNGYASVRGVYESGLLAPRLSESGEIEPVDSFGVQVEGGVYGGKDWRRHSVGLDYRADYRHQPAIPGFNGTNQAVSLSSQHRLGRRLLLVLQQTGGTSNRAFGGFAAPYIGNTDSLGVPLNEFFDVRIYYLQSAAQLGWQKSARTSFTLGVDGFFVKRKSFSLVNGQGFRGQAGYQYRLSRVTTVVAQAGFMRFEFPRVFSHSDVYNAALGFQRRFGRNWQANAFFGVYQLKSTGVEQVALNPLVAEILGRSTGQVAFDRTDVSPLVDLSVAYTQERGRFQMNAASGVTPGNGVFLTMRRTSVSTGYSYTGIRRVSLGVSGGWTRTDSLVLTLGSFDQYQAGGGMTYKLAEHLSLMMQADRRSFQGRGGNQLGRSGSSVSVGLAYSPSRFPLSIF